MTITLRAATTPTNQSTTTATVGLPSGTTTGDVTIIASVSAQAGTGTGGATATVPTGWTAVSNTPGFLVCYRAYQAGDPTTVSITWSASAWVTTGAVTYAGCDTANPIDGSNRCLAATLANATPPLRAPSVAPRYASGQIVCAYAYGASSSGIAITLPSGLTSQSSSTAGPSLTIADEANGSTNAPTGDKTASILSTSGNLGFGCQILLKASGAAALAQASNFFVTAGLYQQSTIGGPAGNLFSLSSLGAQPGDLIMLPMASTATTITPPTGWTTLQTSVDGLLCYRVAQSGDPNSPGFSLSSSASTSYEIVVLRPAYALTSGSVSVDTSGQSTATSTNAVTAPSLTPATTSEFLALFAATKSGGATWTLAAGPTRDLSSTLSVATQFGWEQPAASPSGSFGWSTSSSLATLTAWSALARLPAPPAPPARPFQMIIT